MRDGTLRIAVDGVIRKLFVLNGKDECSGVTIFGAPTWIAEL